MITMPWGKFRDRALPDVPASYLCWVLEECDNADPWLRTQILYELARRFVPFASPGPRGGPDRAGEGEAEVPPG